MNRELKKDCQRVGLIKLIQLMGILFLMALAGVIVGIDLLTTYHYQDARIDKMRTDYFEQQKQNAKREVERIVNMMNYERLQIEALKGTESYTDDIEAQLIATWMERINNVHFGKNLVGYLFVDNWRGTSLAHGAQADLIGTEMWDYEDSRGNKTTQLLIAASKNKDGGFAEFWWRKPDTGEESPKIVYAKAIAEWELLVGAGVYIEDITQDTAILQAELHSQTNSKLLLFILIVVLAVAIFFILFRFLSHRLKNELDVFIFFFKNSAVNNLKIDKNKLKIEEFAFLADSANLMIDKRRKAEDTLKESEAKLNALFSSLTEMVVIHKLVFNADGEATDYRIIDCNKGFTETTGIRKDDAIGKLASEVYQTDPPPYLEKYARVGMGGEPHEFTAFNPHLDKHFMISVISPQMGEFATITTDVSTMMEIQEKIIAKNKEMENYLYVASHDLRTPLVNIQGFSQRLKKQADSIKNLFSDTILEPELLNQLSTISDEDIPKTLTFIISNIEKMDTLINGLLQLSRTGTVGMKIQKIDMNALFVRILQNLDFQIKTAQCKIHIDPLPECYGDTALLDQLFANIISNALKYSDTDRDLEITVDAKKIHNGVVYTIRDTGRGIEQKHLDKIWDLFYRIDPRSEKTGEGIGLSLVKRIAEKHKGKVWVESEENIGSVFFIELHNHLFTEL